MTCSLDNFRNDFPDVKGVRNNITNHPQRSRIIQWINAANNQASEIGFDKPLFELEFKKSKSLRGHSYHRDAVNTQVYLNIDEKTHAHFEDFLYRDFLPTLDQEQLLEDEFLDSFQQDERLSQEALEVQDERDDRLDTFFSGMPFDSDPDPEVETPVNFREWKEKRISLLESLNEIKKRSMAKRESRDKRKQINVAIKRLENEIESFDETNPEFVHGTVVRELEVLNSLLDLNVEDPVQAATIMETNKIRERIEDLKVAFYDKVAGGNLYLSFQNGLDKEKVDAISRQVTELELKYKNSLEGLIYNIIMNNELILQHKIHFKNQGREDEFNDFVQKIEELLDPENIEANIDGDSLLGKNFLGISSYDSILAEIISITRDINKSKEVGITMSWKRVLKRSYDKIKNIKIDGEYFIDKLYQYDEYGVRQSKLIDYISEKFKEKRTLLHTASRDFYYAKAADKDGLYKNWARIQKLNVDYIQLYKIKSFKDKFGEKEEFREFFKYSDAEMEAYEKEMRETMGDTAFELELQKVAESAANFLSESFSSPREKEHKNPLKYIENFYSENFDKSSDKGDFYLPSYLTYIPKLDEDYYNEEFKQLENQIDKNDFKNFYISAKKLADYTRKAAQSAGVSIETNDIINLRDATGREAKANLNAFQGIWLELKVALTDLWSNFYGGGMENPDFDPKYDKNNRKFRSKYGSYGDKDIFEMKKILARKSMDDLIKIALEEGLKTPPPHLKSDNPVNRAKISEAIARNRVNKSSSLDLYKRISYGAVVAESINTRLSVMGLMGIIKDYTTTHNVKNVGEYNDIWFNNNILQVGYQDHGVFSKYERKKIGIMGKMYTESEKDLLKVLEGEKENMGNEFNFTYDGIHYLTEKGKHYKDTPSGPEEVSLETMEEMYGLYLDEKIKNLGVSASVGSVMLGLSWNMFKHYLWTSLPSGWKNRLQGYNQNNEAAASGLYGFDMDDLIAARKFLAGTNLRKTLNYTGLPRIMGISNTKRAQQIDILYHLADSLGLLENIMEEMSLGDGGTSFIGETKIEKFKEVMSDFAMNNPEFHNQMEIMVAKMMNTKIEKYDENGNIIPGGATLYDKKTKSFPYDPKTMKLKHPFNTPNNIKNWQEFVPTETGEANHSIFIQSYNHIKHRLHGNYRIDDRIAIQSTITGRATTAFMKWSYENLNNQYGTKQVSLATAEINIKGRKVPMIERLPILGTHFILQNLRIGATGAVVIGGLSGGIPLIIGGVVAVNTAFLGYMLYRNRKNIDFSWNDFATSANYATEVALRSIKTIVSSNTRGMVNPFSDSFINRMVNADKATYKDRNLDFKTRKILSESAQEVANKYNMAVQFQLIGLTLKAAYLFLTAGEDDDEEDIMRRGEEIEGNMRFLINTRNQLQADTEKWTNLAMIGDTYGTVVQAQFMMDSYRKIIQSPYRYMKGDISAEEAAFNMAEGTLGPTLGIPKQALNIVNPGKEMFSDKTIYSYSQKSWLDEYLTSSHLTGEAKFANLVGMHRKKTRKALAPIYRKKVREAIERTEEKDFSKMEDIVSRHIDEKLRRSGARVNKKKGITNEVIYNNVDWKEVVRSAKDEEVNLSILSPKPKKKTTSTRGGARSTGRSSGRSTGRKTER